MHIYKDVIKNKINTNSLLYFICNETMLKENVIKKKPTIIAPAKRQNCG